MTIQSHANCYAKGKRDALMGKPSNPGDVLPNSYRHGYKKGLAKLERDAPPEPVVTRNPMACCASCGVSGREKEFDVYDSANDEFYCIDEERMASYD